jgi:ubiquinone/menaquinone biosynthesis C-methylase UbiE
MKKNFDDDVIKDFGNEWEVYDQSMVDHGELRKQFLSYFKLFPWSENMIQGVGADFGCGTGRWAKFVAEKVGFLLCLDASGKAISVAKKNLLNKKNCHLLQGRIDSLPILDNSLDFAYSLGVLHHLPKTANAIDKCVRKLKSGAPFLIYLYYAFDNRPKWYFLIWKCSDLIRRAISKSPFYIKYFLSNVIALIVYLPLAKLSFLLEKMKFNVSNIPLSEYKTKSFYTMRTDSLDRFGTRLEQRFTQKQIQIMMESAGLVDIKFSDSAPYWCAIGIKS